MAVLRVSPQLWIGAGRVDAVGLGCKFFAQHTVKGLLRNGLGNRLHDLEPNFVPSYLQVVEAIPKTISEKALDRVLREEFAPEADSVYPASAYP